MITGFEMKSLRKIMNIHYSQHMTNQAVRQRVQVATNQSYKELMTAIFKRQLRWYGHTIRKNSNNFAKLSFLGLVNGNRSRGRPRATWCNILLKEANLSRHEARLLAADRTHWKYFISRSNLT